MKAPCTWSFDDDEDSGIWNTTCGQAFVFEDGGPWRNGMKFCGYCGKPLREVHIQSKHKAQEDEA